MSVSLSQRFKVLNRDNFTCQYCGRSGCQLEIDHIHAKANGGNDKLDNLVTACFECNRGKRDTSLIEKKSSDLCAFTLNAAGLIEYMGRIVSENNGSIRLACFDAMMIWFGLVNESGELKDVPRNDTRIFQDQESMLIAAKPILARMNAQ